MEPSPAATPASQSLSDVLNWRSLRWNDGCTYEGLEAHGACESHGVVTWPARRERYEGQLVGSRPHGHGAYRWRDGTLYRGEWYAGHMHGCGVLIWRDAQGDVQAQAGKFFADDFVGAVSGCSAEDAHEAALEADMAAARARSFEATRRASAGAIPSKPPVPASASAVAAAAAMRPGAPPSAKHSSSSSSYLQHRGFSSRPASGWGGGGGGGGSTGRWAAARAAYPLTVVKASAGGQGHVRWRWGAIARQAVAAEVAAAMSAPTLGVGAAPAASRAAVGSGGGLLVQATAVGSSGRGGPDNAAGAGVKASGVGAAGASGAAGGSPLSAEQQAALERILLPDLLGLGISGQQAELPGPAHAEGPASGPGRLRPR